MLRSLIFICITFAVTVSPVQAKRLALVIGNASYLYSRPLKNPLNDVREMKAKLEKLGFEVTSGIDLGYEDDVNGLKELKNLIRDFADKIKEEDEVLFYYAGHAVQFNGLNYIIPVDADVRSEEEIEFGGLNINFLLVKLSKQSASINIVILDACRNNPFERSFNRGTNEEGLAFLSAPEDTFLSYATAPGQVSSDGKGDNSPFTTGLLKHIGTPGISIEETFKRVRNEVQTLTNNEQLPFDTTSLTRGFCFNSCEGNPNPIPTPPPVSDEPPPITRAEQLVKDLSNDFYRRLIEVDLAELLNMYNYPENGWYGQYNLSKEELRKKYRSYFNLYTKREGKLENIEVDKSLSTDSFLIVELTFKYRFVRKEDGKKRKGRSKTRITFQWIKGEYLITDISEEISRIFIF